MKIHNNIPNYCSECVDNKPEVLVINNGIFKTTINFLCKKCFKKGDSHKQRD